MTWTASTGAATYNVYRGTTAGGEATAPIASGITAQSYSDTGLTSGTKYYYKVAAVNAAGTSALSIEVSATPGGSLPAAPTGLTAIAGNASVFLRWFPSKGATSYNVYRGTASGAESATPIATGLKWTEFVNIHLTNGTKYYYKVAAVDAAGTSALSGEATAAPSSRRLARGPEVSPDDSGSPSGL